MAIKILTSVYEPFILPGGGVVELDLGCGKGRFAAEIAARRPDRLVLAADVMLGRLRKAAGKAERGGLDNMDFLRVEAWMLVARMLPPESLSRVHILCPDPWPKKKHKGNRLMSSEFISRLAVALRPDGVFHFASDDKIYMDSTKRLVDGSGLFSAPDASLIEDVADIKTEFELLWEREGRTVEHRAWKKDAQVIPANDNM